jgi:uncharacterized membrane protein YvbJ
LPYCRRCGTKLDEDAHFCHRCGTPVAVYVPPPARAVPDRPIRKEPVVIAAVALIAILLVAVVVVAIIAAPTGSVNFNQTDLDSHQGINTLNLNFQADNAQVDIITQNIPSQNILIITSASGSKGILDSNNPVKVTFTNETQNNVLTINTKVTEANGFFKNNFHVTCTIYVNPALNLNLNVTTQAGKITLDSEKPAVFQSVNLQAKAGNVEVNLQNATVPGNFVVKTSAGSVYYGLSQVSVLGNQTVDLQSNAGSVTVDITQTKTMQGNLHVNARTDVGSVNVNLVIDGDVGAKLVSNSSLGSIHTDTQNFSGDQSPIQSNNYPAASNIEINSQTNLGGININGAYQSSSGPSIKN